METTVTLVCDHCKCQFSRRLAEVKHCRDKRQIASVFCSRHCKNTSERALLPESITTDYLSGMTLVQVGAKYGVSWATIRKHLIRKGVPLRPQNSFLSDDRNPTKGKGHSEATKAKLRAATIQQFSDPAARAAHSLLTCKQIAEGRTGKAFNKLEQRVAEILADEGHTFIWQHREGFFVYDFFIAATNTLVEAHGTFWHADPRFYDHNHLSVIQRRNLANDRRKATYAANHGFQLRIVREADIM